MTYYTRISYYDDTPTEIEHCDSQEDAADAYRANLETRQDAGRAYYGDCARISWGRIVAGKLKPINAQDFD